MREAEVSLQDTQFVGIGWVLQEIREWAEVVHSGHDRRISPTGHGLHGWDGPDHREREIEDARSTRDASVGSKREDQPSSRSGKRQKTSASHEFQDQGQDWACETGLPPNTGIPRLWDSAVPVNCRTGEYKVHSSTP